MQKNNDKELEELIKLVRRKVQEQNSQEEKKPSGELVGVTTTAELVNATDLKNSGGSISKLIAQVARVSTGKNTPETQEEAARFVNKLIEWGHFSPFEFFDMTFFCRTSRAVTHELVRHRLASFMQESQRYVDYTKRLEVVLPDTVQNNEKAPMWAAGMFQHFFKSCRASYDGYLYAVSNGATKEDARVLLPEATATHIYVKMNLREFRHFLSLRTAQPAWIEMRILAKAMIKEFARVFGQEMFLIGSLER